MKKIFISLVFVLITSLTSAAGVEKLLLDDVAYESYLKRITHSKALPLGLFSGPAASYSEYIGQRVTVLGFVRPVDGTKFFTRGYLADNKAISGAVENAILPLQFVCEAPINYKPFEVYQVTGVLEKTEEAGSSTLLIRASFAEPQGGVSKIIYSPDLSSEAAALPALSWNNVDLPRDEIGNLIATDPLKIEMPARLKELAGQRVSFETWIVEPEIANFAPPASGSHYISLYVITDGTCRCCGIKVNYDMANVAMLKPAAVLSEYVKGGLFTGVLTLNAASEFATNGLFTISDAILIRPLNLPDVPVPAVNIPEIDRKDLLPALFLKPKKQ